MSIFEQQIIDSFQKSIVRITDEFLEPPIMIQVCSSDSIIGTLGNFSASTGKAKSRKTFNVISIVAAALSGKQILQYKVQVPEKRRKVIYVDTEQGKYHCHRLLKRIYKLIDYPEAKIHDDIIFIALREFPTKDRINIIEYVLSKYGHEISLLVIDGIRDLVFDINNATEATDITNKLMKWSQELNIHIHTVLHLNKGDENSRGHLGTELNNKAETILVVSKDITDSNYSIVTPKFIRDIEFDPFAFYIEEGIPKLNETFDLSNAHSKKVFDYQELSESTHRTILEKLFHEKETSLNYSELIPKIQEAYTDAGYSFGINKAKLLKTFLENKRMIIKEDKGYKFNPEFYY